MGVNVWSNMTTWKLPPIIKIYEALGAIGDKRINVKNNTATVASSSGNKQYEVTYDPTANAITANDNGSYWQGYIGYPAIAFLMKKGVINYDKKLAKYFSSFHWKAINTKFKNDFSKTEEYIKSEVAKKEKIDIQEIDQEGTRILQQIEKLKLQKLPSKLKPAKCY